MLTFLVCLTALVIAYFTYGRYLERVAAIDPARSVPSETLFDGVDYVPMPRWRVFLIQLLNIAGTGPIFGAILGAAFGPVAFLWITLGGIFMGAMHDFLSGVMLVRNDGLSIPEVAGRYLGTGMRQFMRLFSVVLLVLVGAVFLLSPADILSGMVPSVPHTVWVWLILAYYFVATLLPIDKIIGRFKNPYLKDDVTRVGREPLRKLSSTDRLVKPMMTAREYGLPCDKLLLGIGAALHYNNPEDPQSVKMQELIAAKGLRQAVSEITSIPATDPVIEEIAAATAEVEKRIR